MTRKMDRLLLVDDDAMDIRLISRSFAKTAPEISFETHLGSAGASERVREGDIDLVLLDINMPGLNGFEVLEQLRDKREGGYPAVVMLTTSDNDSDVKRAFDSGANAYLVKPSSQDGMRELVSSLRDFWANHALAANG